MSKSNMPHAAANDATPGHEALTSGAIRLSVTAAITGMNATDNPAPGVAVARCLRHESAFSGRLIGLGYDPLDPGFYAQGLLDGGIVMPYPSAGQAAMLERLKRARELFGIELLLPTLDSELRAVALMREGLKAAGIATFTPTLESIEAASKAQLSRLGERAGFAVPDSEPVVSVDALPPLVARLGFPLVIKGVYYGAEIVHSEADANLAFHRFAATWGLPVIVQRFISGEEYNVAGLGDGEGTLVGAVPMRKMMLTDKGKGWAGVTVAGEELVGTTRRIVQYLGWRGGLEVEFLRETSSGKLYVAEINPRFPAWIYLSASAGQNLPFVWAELAVGAAPRGPLPPHRVGIQFVRIALDQVSDLTTYGQLSTVGHFTPADEVSPEREAIDKGARHETFV